MDTEICKKVTSMMSLYIDNRLDEEDKLFVEDHLARCPNCQQKYMQMKNIIKNLKVSYEKILKEAEKVETANLFNIKEYEKFYNNISAYIDNELTYEEGVEFRKYLLKSKMARNDLGNAYHMQTLIKNSISNIKYPRDLNFSKKIISQLKNDNLVYFRPKMYQKIAIVAGICVFSSTGLFLLSNLEPASDTPKPPIEENIIEDNKNPVIETESNKAKKEYKTTLYSLEH